MNKKIISKNNRKVILVDPYDHQIGLVGKLICHRYGMLHRAFSIFIFRKRKRKIELLLQQRSKNKYHGGGLWTNTCCSHPRFGALLIHCAEKKLKSEMGFKTKLIEVGKFHYIAKMNNGMTENEIDHVLIGYYDSDNIFPNPKEVQAYQWVNITMLKQHIKKNPHLYTPWLYKALEIALYQK